MASPSQRRSLRDSNASVRADAVLELIFAPDPELLPELLNLTEDPDTDVRRTTMQALGALNSVDALQGLRQSLLDPIPEVAEAAQAALIKSGQQALELLSEWLQYPEWPQRVAALRALADLSPAHELIAPLVLDSIWEVRAESYLTLSHLKSSDAVQLLLKVLQMEQHPQAREALFIALGQTHDLTAFKILTKHFLDPVSQESYETLASALLNYGQALHAPLLSSGIWSPIPTVRMLSAALLANSACPNLVQQLSPLLLDPQAQVRQTVAYAMYESDHSQTIWQFVADLYHSDDHIFEGAVLELLAYPGAGAGERLLEALDITASTWRSSQIIRALGELKYEAAIHVLVEYLETSHEADVIEALIWSLGQLKAWRAWHLLQRLLGHEQKAIRQLACEALIQVDPETSCWQELPQIQNLNDERLAKVLAHLASYTDTWNWFEYKLLFSADAVFRGAILAAVHYFPSSLFQKTLSQYLERYPRPEKETLDALLSLLDRSGINESIARSLLSWLEEREAEVRSRVVRLLKPWSSQLKHELIAAASHEIWFIRQAALEVLMGNLDPDVLQLVRQALRDRDRDVRITAIHLLSRYPSSDIVPELIDALENGFREVRAAAAQALGAYLEKDTQAALVLALVEDESAEVRTAAAESLGRATHRQEAICENLIEAFEDDDALEVQLSSLKSLYQLDEKVARPYVLQAFKDDDPTMLALALQLWSQSQWPIDPIIKQLKQLIHSEHAVLQSGALRLLLPGEPELVDQWLKSDQEALKIACMQHMQKEQIEKHQITLVLQLSDPSPQIRQQTLKTIFQVPVLRSVLANHARGEEDPSVLQVLIELIANLPMEESLPVYQEILERPSPRLHTSVIWALGPMLALGGGSILQSLLPNSGPELRTQIFQVLSHAGIGALSILHDLSDHWDRDLVLRAIRAMGQMGLDAVPLLEEIWEREELSQQLAVLEACAQIKRPETQSMLLKAARSSHDNLRAYAIEALLTLGPSVQTGLLKLLSDPDARIRFDAAYILSVTEPEQPIWRHLRGISSSLASVRLKNLIALQQHPSEQWLSYSGHLRRDPFYVVRAQFCQTSSDETAFRRWLIRCLQTEVLPVCEQAVLAIVRSPEPDTPMHLMNTWIKSPASLREVLLTGLASLGLVGQAMQGLEDISAHVRITAACIAGRAKLETAFYRLVQILHYDNHWEVRAACAWALGQYQQEEALPFLEDVLQNETHPAVLHQSILAIAQIGSVAAGMMLVNLLERQNWDVFLREETLFAVSKLRLEAAVPLIINKLGSEDDFQIRKQYLDTLGLIANAEALGYLRELAAYESDTLSLHAKRLLVESSERQTDD